MNCMQMLKHLSTNSRRSALSKNLCVGGVWLWNKQSKEAVSSAVRSTAAAAFCCLFTALYVQHWEAPLQVEFLNLRCPQTNS